MNEPHALSLAEAYRFCPYCGRGYAAGDNIGDRPSGKRCANCGGVAYFNSAPTVGAIIMRGREVLLGRRALEPFRGDYSLPGGFAEEGEDPAEALRREVREETGLEVVRSELVGAFPGIYPGPVHRWTFNVTYLVPETTGEPTPASDVEALAWFPLDRLPPNLPFPDNRAALAAVRGRFTRHSVLNKAFGT